MAPPRSTEFKPDTYKRKKLIIKNRLQNIKTAIEVITAQVEPLSVIQQKRLNAYLAETESKKSEFESLLDRAVTLENDEELPIDVFTADQDEISELNILISSYIGTLINSNEPVNISEPQSDIVVTNSASQLRLPKLNLLKFNGELSAWTSFINLFETTIHRNTNIPEVMKFQYLLSVLQGEPFNLVKSLNLTAENYAIAYKLLQGRYHNTRRLQSLHLNKLLDLPAISAPHIQSLRQFVNMFTENTQALEALDCPVHKSNPLLATVLLRKMDAALRKRLEEFRSHENSSKHTLPTVNEIIDFLTSECNHSEDASLQLPTRSIEPNQSLSRNKGYLNKVLPSRKPASLLVTQSPSMDSQSKHAPPLCFVCNQPHKVYSCPVFTSKTPNDRYQLIKSEQRCVSCLGSHNFKQCRSQSTCRVCHKKHHSLLHFNDNSLLSIASSEPHNNPIIGKPGSTPKEDTSMKKDVSVNLTSHTSLSDPDSKVTVLLGTLLIQLRTHDGNTHIFRALLDSGSMCDLISEYAANILNVRRQKSNIQLAGISQNVTQNKGQIHVDITNLSGQLIAPRHPFLILDKLTVDLPRVPVASHVLKHTQTYDLADPNFHIPGRIDVVLGGSLFPHVFTNEQHSLGTNLPTVLGTRFGYIVMGTTPCLANLPHYKQSSSSLNVSLHITSDADLHDSIQRFWKQEEPPICSVKTLEDDLCDNHFITTHKRDKDGRYIVRLPFKDEHPALGTSIQAAKTRLAAMERKFVTNHRFSHLYHDFMNEYVSLGHMSLCSNDLQNEPHYFLPHHGVMKESSSTTKLRTVFDASCKTSTGVSLNDILLTGRKLQVNICDLLMQFRRHNIVFCCDIRQMYRQILIHPDDRNFQLILWRNSPQLPLTTYQLNTVTYGMNSSPYLAIRTLHQLADDEGKNYPQAAYVLKHHTYVDDIITGATNETDALRLQTELISLLQCGGFELRKWVSNSPLLLNNVPESHLETPTFLQESHTPQFTILGLKWSPSTDSFSYNFELPSESHPTKRTVLSNIAKIYDPCGFLVPFIMLMKCFMQLLWTKGISWDERSPADLIIQWNLIKDNVSDLKNITIPRSLHLDSTCLIQLHGFCDASESGYAAIVYFRCEFPDYNVKINPIIAKSRVAPLKRVTIPRLELCAAQLLSQLVSHCRNIFSKELTNNQIYLWSDSTIALSWIRTPSFKLKTYIANRVASIQELVPSESWRHISSEDNPADCASRGILPSQLAHHPLWWTGPDWLSKPHSEFPTSNFTPIILDASHELKDEPLTVLTTTQTREWSLLTQFSSWDKLVRVMALVIRFCHNSRFSHRRVGFITTDELCHAKLKVFSILQRRSFPEEFSRLENHEDCTKRIQRLNPFLDEHGLIRVGGRLNKATLSFDAKHPILLPKRHHVVDLLIDYYHLKYLHAGPQLIQSILSSYVWILSARSRIRSRIHKCITCFKNRPTNVPPLMGDLPTSRVIPAKPFLSTGVDYCGPFTIKVVNMRFVKHIKVYMCLFICMVTKAIHIEVVTDYTTDAFLAALTRFMSRRGKCTDLYSDCGTNFTGADALLKKTIDSIIRNHDSQTIVERFIATHGIKFHFNPPASPHHGGLWERAIRSAKHHLRRVMGNTILTLSEFITLTTRIEAMLNSRPITSLSNDPSDLTALTPGHFLVGSPLISLTESDNSQVPQNRLKHWRLVQQLHLHIWRRWSREYLYTLQQRTKWTKRGKNVKVGDLVLVNSDSSPLNWPLARVVTLHPGSDGIIRVVTLRTSTGTLTRPVTKIFPLPCVEEEDC